MNKGWLELESDPGLFTLLVEDFGTKGVQVEEVYDLQKSIDGPVYGFIFLFRWIEERRCRRKTNTEEESFVVNDDDVNSMFFAQQIIPNSCATHALVSVLLNVENVCLGDTLSELKEFSKHMNPEDKGHAIGNMPELARAHNSHARPEPRQLPEKQQGVSAVRTMEAFHFVSYVPINGHLFELDGLKPYPIDHGPYEGDWTEKFRKVISERLGMATGGEPYHDIRFNLMAVVPDRRQHYEQKLTTLKTNRQIVLEALQQMVKVTTHGISEGKSQFSPPLKQLTKKAAPLTSGIDSSHIIGPQGDQSNAEDSKIETGAKIRAALASHDYAKSPNGLDGQGSEESQDVDKTDVHGDYMAGTGQSTSGTHQPLEDHIHQSQNQHQHYHSVRENKLKIQISVADENGGGIVIPKTVSLTDVTKPLTIETKFSGSSGPSSENTDTASEVGSCFSSPNSYPSCQNSPNLERLNERQSADLVARSLGSGEGELALPKELHFSLPGHEDKVRAIKDEPKGSPGAKSEPGSTCSSTSSKTKFSSQHGFKPKDLLALLKNVENEIANCDDNLRDEVEKRKKYKIDDCRRTHNYDQFICTFLYMLAEQGQLSGLVEQHMLVKRRQGVAPGRLHKSERPQRPRPARTKRRR